MQKMTDYDSHIFSKNSKLKKVFLYFLIYTQELMKDLYPLQIGE